MNKKVTRVAANPGCGAATLVRSAQLSSSLTRRGQVFFLHTASRHRRSDHAAQSFPAADAGAETPALISRTARHTLETEIRADRAVQHTPFHNLWLYLFIDLLVLSNLFFFLIKRTDNSAEVSCYVKAVKK